MGCTCWLDAGGVIEARLLSSPGGASSAYRKAFGPSIAVNAEHVAPSILSGAMSEGHTLRSWAGNPFGAGACRCHLCGRWVGSRWDLRAFLLRRTLQNAADASALAGSGGLDSSSYYSSGGRRIVLDPDAARRAALELLQRRGIDGQVSVIADASAVQVNLRGEASTSFLSLVGIRVFRLPS